MLPNLVVIGAQKCGTSGLHYQLSLHPEIWMSRPKELNFFIEERNWSRGQDWYRHCFDARAKVRGESSPNYTAYPQHLGVPERMPPWSRTRSSSTWSGIRWRESRPLGPQLREAP